MARIDPLKVGSPGRRLPSPLQRRGLTNPPLAMANLVERQANHAEVRVGRFFGTPHRLAHRGSDALSLPEGWEPTTGRWR
jgi:hypothetical protein